MTKKTTTFLWARFNGRILIDARDLINGLRILGYDKLVEELEVAHKKVEKKFKNQ